MKQQEQKAQGKLPFQMENQPLGLQSNQLAWEEELGNFPVKWSTMWMGRSWVAY